MLTPQIADKGVTKHILRSFGLHASRRLGQNFLISPAVVRGVVDAAEIASGDHVLEIGPGIGTLTQGLLEAGAEVTAVELDKKLPAVLAETLRGYEHLTVVQGDILKTDIGALMGGEPFKVAANLPYYITTPILLALLEQKLPITRIVTMVQKEVAERMTASPGGKDYGALSVAVQYHTEPEIVLDVPPNCFLPAPEVDSAVIVCVVRKTPAVSVKDQTLFFRVVKAAFGQRRKTIANALKTLGVSRERIDGALSAADVATERRGETMSLAEFAAVTDALMED
ncbi:MAG: 16S rRNA (adenine(1518)-N(6)/adenine(1519)-N(6))-dimethyltransferase RsmA [Selenomonadaceae bacterium]|nr:16S rRNA (adenine(1518)-N(6)/adenine(1519)-N(6))-dimethyltransferase RsmA [Selenomonadaceae bacterium]